VKEEFKEFYNSLKEGRLRFSQKAYIFLFCILLSTFFWFLSSLSKSYTTQLEIPVKYVSFDEKFVLDQEPPKALTIKVKSNGFELLGEQMTLRKEALQIDLSQARQKRKNHFFLLTNQFRPQIRELLDPDIELLTIQPDSIQLNTQKRIAKKIAVKLQSNYSIKSGYALRGEPILKPESILVSGPADYLATFNEVKTIEVNEKNISDSLHLRVALQGEDGVKGLQYEQSEVELIIPIEKFTEKSLRLPIQIDSTTLSANLITFPNEVEAIVLVPLSKYKQLDANMIQAKVIYNQESKKNKKLDVQLENVPNYAKLVRISPERVEYIIKE